MRVTPEIQQRLTNDAIFKREWHDENTSHEFHGLQVADVAQTLL